MTEEVKDVVEAGIKTGMFVSLEAEGFEGYGINKGDRLFVAGDGLVRISKEDPYLFRSVMLCAKVDSDGHVLAGEGVSTIDGLKLRELPEEEAKELLAIQKMDFPADKAPEDMDMSDKWRVAAMNSEVVDESSDA